MLKNIKGQHISFDHWPNLILMPEKYIKRGRLRQKKYVLFIITTR